MKHLVTTSNSCFMLFHHQTIRKQCKPMQNVRLPLDLQTCTTKSPTQKKHCNEELPWDPKRGKTSGSRMIRASSTSNNPETTPRDPLEEANPVQQREPMASLPSALNRLQCLLESGVVPMYCPLNSGSKLSFPKSTSTCQSDQNASICNRTLV